MDVVGRGTRVAAQQLAAVLAHAAELHVVVVLLHLTGIAVVLLGLGALLSGLPLDALLLLGIDCERQAAQPENYCLGG